MAAIRYLKRQEIDKARWDACIDKAANGLIYAYSFYLDAMCDNWDGLILNDYEAVMPLPWRKKWGVKYIYQPAFIQQLGIFSATNPISGIVPFLNLAERHFKFGEYFINYTNVIHQNPHTNFIIHLINDYKDISKRYKTDLRNNLKKAKLFELFYDTIDDYIIAIKTYKEIYQSKIESLKLADFKRFNNLCKTLHQKSMLCIREVRNKEQDLLAIALCLMDKRRIYLIASSTTEKGRELKATHFLIDQLIQEFAGTDLILDFEGSDLPGVYHFYQNFGGINQPYFFYRWNKLPWPYKLFKRP